MNFFFFFLTGIMLVILFTYITNRRRHRLFGSSFDFGTLIFVVGIILFAVVALNVILSPQATITKANEVSTILFSDVNATDDTNVTESFCNDCQNYINQSDVICTEQSKSIWKKSLRNASYEQCFSDAKTKINNECYKCEGK